jgi:Protein of unknown function (DUF1800)
VKHPAMLRYLDNAENAKGHLNENYAREIMELHTMGVGSGYTQEDVQELARILTGVGVNVQPDPPKPPVPPGYIRAGLFEFNPNSNMEKDMFISNYLEGLTVDKSAGLTAIRSRSVPPMAAIPSFAMRRWSAARV